jgi:hypothetical protein
MDALSRVIRGEDALSADRNERGMTTEVWVRMP